jgi:hypothetical protein
MILSVLQIQCCNMQHESHSWTSACLPVYTNKTDSYDTNVILSKVVLHMHACSL